MENALKRDGHTLTVDGCRYSLNRNVHIVAFGKAVLGMVKTAEEVLGEHVVGGVASVPTGILDTFKRLGKWSAAVLFMILAATLWLSSMPDEYIFSKW